MKFIAFIFVSLIATSAFASSELSKIQSQIKATEAAEKQIQQKVEVSEKEINRTKKDLVRAADKFNELDAERAEIQDKIDDLTKQLSSLEIKLDDNKETIANSAASILFIASHPSFDSDNMRDYVLTSAVLSGAAENFQAEIKIVQDRLTEIEKIRSKQIDEKKKLDKIADKYAAQKKELDTLLKNRSAQNKKLKTEQIDIQKKLKNLSAKAKNISELSAGVGSSKMSGDAKFSRRKLNPPVDGRLIQGFGVKTDAGRNSDGWKISSRTNALVVAPADGEIKFADDFRGFGKIIIMSHKNGYNTVMTNLGQIDVLIGQSVLAGEPVGRMSSNKPEMYLEVRRGKSVVNPSLLFNEP